MFMQRWLRRRASTNSAAVAECRGVSERYGSGFEVKKMSEVSGIKRSGYYAYRERAKSPRAKENERLGRLIRLIWSRSREPG
jgi:hypothetical protein